MSRHSPGRSRIRLLIGWWRLSTHLATLVLVPEQSLLTDEVRALIGSETPAGTVQVTPRGWRHAVEVYTGRVPAETPAPGESVSGYAIAALETENGGTSRIPDLMPNSLLIANQWEFERPLRMGETLTASSRIVDITERFGGRFGYSIDFRTESVYRDPTGAVVARGGITMTQYDVRDARSEEGAG